jgi:hypothetical protein
MTALVIITGATGPASAQIDGNGTLKGRAYYDLVKGVSDVNDHVLTFHFRRIYFTYDVQMSENIRGRFRTDVKQDGETRVLMKHAYADWAVSNRFSLRAGLQGTILFGAIEDVWGYRHLEKTLEDLFDVRSSADFGFSGSVRAGSMLNIKGMLSNGEGYDKRDDPVHRKALEAQGIFTPIEGLTISAHFGRNGYDEDRLPATTDDQEDRTTTQLGLGYEGENYAVGGSIVRQANYEGSTGVDASGFWVFGRYSLAESPIGFVGAYYRFDRDTDFADDEFSYFVVGLDYSPGAGLNIIPNVRSRSVGTAHSVNQFVLTLQWKW